MLAAFSNPYLAPLADAALLPDLGGQLVMTTDSSVVNPLFFPGGDIGSLAVHSAINDLAVSGAEPLYLSVALILEDQPYLATWHHRQAHRVLLNSRQAQHETGYPLTCHRH